MQEASASSVACLPFRKSEQTSAWLDISHALELDAVRTAPDQSTWIGRRDYALLQAGIDMAVIAHWLGHARPPRIEFAGAVQNGAKFSRIWDASSRQTSKGSTRGFNP